MDGREHCDMAVESFEEFDDTMRKKFSDAIVNKWCKVDTTPKMNDKGELESVYRTRAIRESQPNDYEVAYLFDYRTFEGSHVHANDYYERWIGEGGWEDGSIPI